MPGAIASFAELVAPLSRDDFRVLLAARTPRHLPGAGGGGAGYAALIDWDGLIGGMREGRFPTRHTRLYRDRVKVPKMFLRDEGTSRAEAIDRLLAANASIILNCAEQHVAPLGRLCAAVAEETGDHVSAAVIATRGQGGALDLHYDDYDIIVLQVDGTKSWSLHTDPVINPVNGMPLQPSGADDRPLLEARMQPGDWLYVPAGYRHRCDDTDGRSLHVSILFYPLSPVRAVELMLRDMLTDPADRAPLRFDDADAAATEAALKRRLIARIDALSLDALGRLHRASGAQPPRDKAD